MLVNPAYVLVRSIRLLQLCIKNWLLHLVFTTVTGLIQFFLLRTQGKIYLFLRKKFEEIPIAKDSQEANIFYTNIPPETFNIGLHGEVKNRIITYEGMKIFNNEKFNI